MLARKGIFVGLLLSLFVLRGSYAVPAVVKYIVDGDTFSAGVRLADDTIVSVKVRLRNVDTPELHGECIDEIVAANVARNRLAELLPVDSVVELENIRILEVKNFNKFGGLVPIVNLFGGKDKYLKVVSVIFFILSKSSLKDYCHFGSA